MEQIQPLYHLFADMGKLLHKLGFEVAVHAQQVLRHKHLAIHIGTGPDTQDRHADRLSERLANYVGYALHNN